MKYTVRQDVSQSLVWLTSSWPGDILAELGHGRAGLKPGAYTDKEGEAMLRPDQKLEMGWHGVELKRGDGFF
jgi:hypothetical protein